jgi:exonuclease VII small subunit
MKNSKNEKKFDDGMAELEAIVARLERGELPLEEGCRRGPSLTRRSRNDASKG